MATDTFTWCVRIDAEEVLTVATISAQFGDGYKQVSGVGINQEAESWTLACNGSLDAMREAQPTPKLSIGNVANEVTALCLQFDDLVKFKVRIHTTLMEYLDAANWIAGNPDANPSEENLQTFYVNAKTAETRVQVDFELCSPFDVQGLQLPARQITSQCEWCRNGWYRSGTGCDYAGTKYFTADGTPTDNPALDKCGGLLIDCRIRYGDEPMPFGGFPAANLQAK